MKRISLLLTGIAMAFTGMAQTDSSSVSTKTTDTIRIGNMVIIKSTTGDNNSSSTKVEVHKEKYRPKNISTNWWIVDLGLSLYNDQTNYAGATAQAFAPGATEDWFELRNGKSVNVNLWFFMQRINMIKHVVNLKYGLGLELNNYRYKTPIKYETSPTMVVYDNSTTYRKNKLAADYLTVPFMLNFNFTPYRRKGFGFSAGASVGYLYSSRQKTITGANGKQKEHDDFDLRPWKLSYIGELSLGPVRLYGSLATQSMFKHDVLDQTPYTVGFRLSNW